MKHSSRPTHLHTIYDLQANEYKKELQCFLWQQSVFYNLAYFGSHAWGLRWFTITPDKVTSVPDRQDSENGRMIYPKFTEIQIDEKRLIINMPNPNKGERDFTVMAPSKEIFDKVVTYLDLYMTTPLNQSVLEEIKEIEEDPNFEDSDNHEDLTEFPSDGSNTEIIFFILLFPLRFLMQYSLPDVRKLDSRGNPMNRITHAFGATTMCLIWLIIGR